MRLRIARNFQRMIRGVGIMNMNRLRTFLLLVALVATSCSTKPQAIAPREAEAKQAITQLLNRKQDSNDAMLRFHSIVEARLAKGEETVEVLIRTAGQPSQDQSKGFSLTSQQFVPFSEVERRSAYQFVVMFDPGHERCTVRVANLHFLFGIEDKSVVFEKSEAEEILPPATPPE
jgi:hypothetical protein